MYLLLFLLISTANAQNISEYCTGNFSESCFVYIDGPITANTWSELRDFDRSDSSRVVLNSPGGNLIGGIFLGVIIRDLGLTTEVGKANMEEDKIFASLSSEQGFCASSCAYAFLGGVERDKNSLSRLGFHRFYNPYDFKDTSIGPAGLLRATASEDAQKIYSLLVSYIVEMGVDARMLTSFQDYGADAVFTFPPSAGLQYGIVTNKKFDTWFIEPYGKSIVAASRRVGLSHAYDQVHQVTTYCKTHQNKRQSYILISTPLNSYHDPQDIISGGATLYYSNNNEDIALDIAPDRIRGWSDKTFMQIELALDGDAEQAITQKDKFDISLNTSRVQGLYFYNGETSKRERDFIKASFLHCK